MMFKKQTPIAWSILLLLLTAVALLAACSGGDQMLLAEYNRDGEATIFLAGLGDEESDWQTLAEDAQFARVFQEGELAAFVPDSNRVVLWYEDRDEVVVELLELGDESTTKIFDGDFPFVFGEVVTDPFMIFLSVADFDETRCYVSMDNGEADRVARADFCFITENGVITRELKSRAEVT